VAFANGRTESLAVDRVGEFVTEVQNPGNEKRLTRLLLEYPSEGLPEGVIFVDTPGLGSLASAGALQTFAYLPRCDHATFLLDATAPVVEEDLALLAFLHDSGITTSVLLSKADLLSPADLAQVQAYVARQVRSRLGADLQLRAVSAMPTHAALLSAWIDEEVKPLGARARAHGQDALARKVAALRGHVSDALKGRTIRNRPTIAPEDSRRLRERVRDVAKRLDEVDRDVRDLGMARSGLVERTLAGATGAIVEALGRNHNELDYQPVRAALMRPAQALAETTAATVADLAKLIRDAIAGTAEAIAVTSPSLEFGGVEREVPLIDIPTLTTPFQPPLWARVSRFTLERWVADRVRSEWSEVVDRVVGNYLDVLRRWGTERLTVLRREFDSHSRPLLAQIVMRPQADTTNVAASAVERDLEWLVGPRASDPEVVRPRS
jgi:GTP-binding protein EngB required for normal cell division